MENVKLAPELLDPDPTILNSHRGPSGRAKTRDPDGAWSGDATRSAGIDYKSTVTINYDDEKEKEQERKERLAWMEESTIEGSMAESIWKEDEEADKVIVKPEASNNNKSRSQDIFNTLLAHEKKGPAFTPVVGLKAPDEEDDDDSDSDDDDMGAGPSKGASSSSSKKSKTTTMMEFPDDDDDDSDDDDGEKFFVSVGGEQIALDDVDDEVTARMTQSEKDAWIQLTQRIYANHYD